MGPSSGESAFVSRPRRWQWLLEKADGWRMLWPIFKSHFFLANRRRGRGQGEGVWAPSLPGRASFKGSPCFQLLAFSLGEPCPQALTGLKEESRTAGSMYLA